MVLLLLEAMGKDVFTGIYIYLYIHDIEPRQSLKNIKHLEKVVSIGVNDMLIFLSFEWFLKKRFACLGLPGGEGKLTGISVPKMRAPLTCM